MAGAQDPLANAASNEEAAMRPAMVSNPMPGEQDVPPDIDADPEAAMREMMGFSSFTTRPKKRLGESTSSIVPKSSVLHSNKAQPGHVCERQYPLITTPFLSSAPDAPAVLVPRRLHRGLVKASAIYTPLISWSLLHPSFSSLTSNSLVSSAPARAASLEHINCLRRRRHGV